MQGQQRGQVKFERLRGWGLAGRKATLQTVKPEIRSRQQSVQQGQGDCQTAAGAHGQYQVPARPSGADSDSTRGSGVHGRVREEGESPPGAQRTWGTQPGSSAAQRLLSHLGRCLHYQLSAAGTRAPSRDRVGTLEPWACLDLDPSVEELQRGALGGMGG